ncbi:S53 family peptidase [Gandjariella thermophila]|uniref:Serine protease n=1 Tax=Gandjariella thermophila TaxID=1931992 RepID=A0A4D4J9J7_9PSEU|nr:S53 family peptidase [Gandjariella thermophila]GDY32234.1 serine protease [Gandjariella thermophila]
MAVVGGVASAVPAAAADDGRATIPASHPLWAAPHARVSDAPAQQQMTFRVYLNLRDPQGAEQAARAVSDPSSPSYRQYLSADQVRARFAPAQSSVDAVRNWLSSAGFRVGEVPANNQYVEATGSVAQAQQAFAVNLGEYAVQGLRLRGTDRDLTVPRSLSSLVASVVGVDQSQELMRPGLVGGSDEAANGRFRPHAAPGTVAPPAGFRNARPCSAYWGEQLDTTDPAYGGGFPAPLPYAPCGYKPGQLRAAYGVDDLVRRGVDGRGTTVAIIDAFASPTIYEDASEYAKRNDPAYPLRQSQFRQLVFPTTPGSEGPDQCDAAGWYGEESLDVEAVHAMAPAANILYVGGSDCQDLSLDKALNTVVAGHLAQIVSNSYGDTGEDLPAAEVKAFESIAIQAALQGIGLYFSSGDNGDEVARLGKPETDFAASSPWVTAVGGTSLGIGKNGRKVLETGWETGKSTLTGGAWNPAAPGAYLYGSGGGTSTLFDEPFYQRGVVPDALAAQNQKGKNQRGRVVPDISMLGDPNTGMLIGLTQTFPEGAHYDEYRIGGTSLACPLLAGEMALADQYAGRAHGFINPALYMYLSRTGAISDVTHVQSGDVRVDYVNGLDPSAGYVRSVRSFDFTGLTIHTAPGYDNVTGLGTPNGAAFVLRI